jgi:hypothetical protein
LVYSKEWWDEEPEGVIGKSLQYQQEQKQQRLNAMTLVNTGVNPWEDTDQNAMSLTRGNEMGLNIVPVFAGQIKRILLDGECREDANQFEWDELLNMNSIPAPASWRLWLPHFEDGYIFLPMEGDGDGWIWRNGKYSLKYTPVYGLERLEENE